MNSQQKRIEDRLSGLRNLGHESSRTVDLVNQTQLLLDGYDLRALDDDLMETE